MGDKTRGLYDKFTVTRNDGSSEPGGKHHGCEYFVLDLTHDKHANAALLAYADSCAAEYPLLAADLREAIAAEEKAEPVFDEGDALTVAYLHGHGKGQDSVQPLLAEKDALLRQALEALEGFINITNDSQGVAGYHLNGDTAEWGEFPEVYHADKAIEAIHNHLGVKND